MPLKHKIVETAFDHLRAAMKQDGLVVAPMRGEGPVVGGDEHFQADIGNGEIVDMVALRERGLPGLWLRLHCDGERLPLVDAFLTGNVLRVRIGATGRGDGEEISYQPAVDFMMALASRVTMADGASFTMSEIAPGTRP